MSIYKVPVIAGDGIGPEIIDEGKKVIEAVGDIDGFSINWLDLPYGADHYLKTGELIDDSSVNDLRKYKSIYLGSLGDPRVEPGILELGILLKLRFALDQYVNLRPVYLFEGISTPLREKGPEDIQFSVIRENTEDLYLGIGSRFANSKNKEIHDLVRQTYNAKFSIDVETNATELAYQIGALTREGAERVITYSFEYAKRKNRKKVTSVDKANVLTYMYGLWREVFEDTAKKYPSIENNSAFVDAVAMWFVKNPEWFEVVVTPNLFGDILTDLGAIIQGGLGVAPGGNINPDGTSMFEPIHGSAPKYAGTNTANPIATILSGGLLLEDLGLEKSGKRIELAVKKVLRERKTIPRDLGGNSKTDEVGTAVVASLEQIEL